MERRPELDGLRGVAVLLVLLSHASNRGLHLAQGLDFGGLGRTGVFLFFVLSSYLLTDQLLARGRRELLRARTWLVYAARRLARVYPAYLLALGVTLALGGMTLPHAGRHLALVRAEGHFWTIPVEMLFYLALPPLALALAVLARPALQSAALVALIVVAALAWPPNYPPVAPDFRPSVFPFLQVFLTGSLVAVVARSGALAARAKVRRVLVVLGALGLAAHAPALVSWCSGTLGVPRELEHDHFHRWFTSQSAAAALLLTGVVAGPALRVGVLASAPLVALGRASYSVYLLHAVPLAYAVDRIPASRLGAAAAVGGAVALGAVSYVLVERPFLRR